MVNYRNILVVAACCFIQVNAKHQPITKEMIARYLPKNPVTLEAGAHNGSDTVEMIELWPTATIYAFEPVPVLLAQLITQNQKI